ncbi:hypothetical protein CCR75_003570 [Bremia lactucae]|uniref:Uncharacterized protein n=1 Tax=Bremia lactucae TaxID=4779 RepID=A0A976FKC5_BRELC|nr:hypothetical protein CCR75_003570 [Bremia lactucae]
MHHLHVCASTLISTRTPVAWLSNDALDPRKFVFDNELGRGSKIHNVNFPIRTLGCAEILGDPEIY